jgi:hypothetical protein
MILDGKGSSGLSHEGVVRVQNARGEILLQGAMLQEDAGSPGFSGWNIEGEADEYPRNQS